MHARDDLRAGLDADRGLYRDGRRHLARHPCAEHASRAVGPPKRQDSAPDDGGIAWEEIDAADGNRRLQGERQHELLSRFERGRVHLKSRGHRRNQVGTSRSPVNRQRRRRGRIRFVAFGRAARRPIEHHVQLARRDLAMRRLDEIMWGRLSRCPLPARCSGAPSSAQPAATRPMETPPRI